MPTGYTYGIIEGKINTFPEFAKICMKAFGACIHMRDDSNDKSYTSQKVSDHHIKAIEEAKRKLAKARTISDNQLIKKYKADGEARKLELMESIIKVRKTKEKLKLMIAETTAWNPPTWEHNGLKRFMLEQLTGTLDRDGDDSYYLGALDVVEESLKNILPNKLRSEMIKSATTDLDYHIKSLQEEEVRIAEANKWVVDLYKSLEK